MEQWMHETEVMREVLLRRLLRALISAAGTLGRAAREKGFATEGERHACAVLARLAPALIGPDHLANELPERDLIHPNARAMMERGELPPDHFDKKPMTREECAQSWAESFEKDGPFDGRYETLEEAMEYGRKRWDLSEAVAASYRCQLTLRGRKH